MSPLLPRCLGRWPVLTRRSAPSRCRRKPRRLWLECWKTAPCPRRRSPSPTPPSTRSVTLTASSPRAAADSHLKTSSWAGRQCVRRWPRRAVLRYTLDRQLLGTFVARARAGSVQPLKGLAFGPDGNLYVASVTNNNILEYNGSTGAFLRAFVSAGSGGLNNPCGLMFGPDGNLYVSSVRHATILRFEGPRGATRQPLARGRAVRSHVRRPGKRRSGRANELDLRPRRKPLRRRAVTTQLRDSCVRWHYRRFHHHLCPHRCRRARPCRGRGIAFDQEGRLYVADLEQRCPPLRQPGQLPGRPADESVNLVAFQAARNRLRRPGRALVSCRDGNTVFRYDRGVTVTLSAVSATPVTADYATADGTATAGKNYTAQSGTVTFAPGQTSRLILLVTQEDSRLDGQARRSVSSSATPPGRPSPPAPPP